MKEKKKTDKQKLREFGTTRLALQQMLKELSYAEKATQSETGNLPTESSQESKQNKTEKKKKRKGKIVKVGNNPYTNVISKPEVTRRGEHKFKKL